MNDPNNGAKTKIEHHHATGFPRPSAATPRSARSASVNTGRVAAIAITTTTNIASV